MVCSKVVFIVKVVLLAQMFSEVTTSQCGSMYSIYGMMLKGHVFKTIKTSMSLECLNACDEDPRCQSFNYVMLEDTCELNNFTKEAGPQYFVKSIDRYYITVKDVDECILGTHNCLADNATCTNTYGTYSCACNPGYEGDGKTKCEMIAPECQNYQSLAEANRKVTYATVATKCDRSIGPGWFRFQGDAGTKMPTSCPLIQRCDTHAPGWINGEHPTVADGKVTRQVCFHWSSNCCKWSTNIEVRSCGTYYIYYFSGTPACSLRYCSTD